MSAVRLFNAVFGAAGIILNTAVAVVTRLDEDMKGPTCALMVQLSVADAMVLFGMLLGPAATVMAGCHLSEDTALGRVYAYCNAFGYRASTIYMALVSFSRWVCFASKHYTNKWFSPTKMIITCAVTWVAVLAVYCPFLFHSRMFRLLPNTGVYVYSNSTYSRLLQVFAETDNVGTACAQIIFNALSVVWIVRMRKQVMSHELRTLHGRELRLFAMCFIDSFMFCLLLTVRYISFVVKSDLIGTALEILFLTNHVDCSVLCLLLNQKLRKAVVKLCYKYVCNKAQGGAKITPVLSLKVAPAPGSQKY